MEGRYHLKTTAFHMLFLLEKNLEESTVIDLDSLYTVLPVSVCEEAGKLLITTASMFDASCIEKMELSLSSEGLFCKGTIADYGYMEGHAKPYTGLTPYEDMLQGISEKRAEIRKRTDEEIEACVEELIGKMTLEEKIGQMEQSAGVDVSEIGMEIESKPMTDQIRDGEIGSLIHMGYAPETVYAYQKLATEKSRLGIPQLVCQDVVHGFQTIMPVPLAQSCSFDEELVRQAARAAAKEATAAGINCAFSPMTDIARDARWGRNVEGFGEDPHLAGRMTRAVVSGYQGENLSDEDAMAACLKHFVGYSAVEGGRDYNTVEMSDHIMHNTFLPPFIEGVKQGAEMVMTAFNVVDGIPVSANKALMQNILRKEINFQGTVVTDFAAVQEVGIHGCLGSPKEIAGRVAEASVDLEMATSYYNFFLKELVESGQLEEEVIDKAVRHILTLKYKLGLMDDPYCAVRPKDAEALILSEEHKRIAEKMAEESMVLLKNQGLLPIDKTKTLALIGPHADGKDLLGPWQFSNYTKETVSFLEGLRKEGYTCIAEKGCDINAEIPGGIERALEAAGRSDVVVLCLGEASNMSGEATSRLHIVIPQVQQELLEALQKAGKPILLVLVNGRPLVLSDIESKVDAVFETWFPGHMGGKALAGLISGRVNPSGRLTISFPACESQVPVYYNYYNTGRPDKDTGDRFVSRYIDGGKEPLYTFGDGLSYSEFVIKEMRLDKKSFCAGESLTVEAEIENASAADGTAVVQLYIRDDAASAVRPVKELKGFRRVFIAAGKTEKVRFTLDEQALSFYTADKKWEAETGTFTVWAGLSSREKDLAKDSFDFKA